MMFEKIKALIINRLNLDEDTVITMDTSFADDLEADSIALVELIMGIEDEYGIEIDDENAEKIKTVRDAIEYLENIIDQKS
ncbi:MAG TPA: acyl carrier protein [Clostridiales bacterium]|nr:acyl carrier protein [Clostridiales bacterium]